MHKLALGLAMGHYGKRELESMFVHIFSRPTVPLAGTLKNYLHYWVMFGACVGSELFFYWKPKKISNT